MHREGEGCGTAVVRQLTQDGGDLGVRRAAATELGWDVCGEEATLLRTA
jgi:hypothetical protein